MTVFLNKRTFESCQQAIPPRILFSSICLSQLNLGWVQLSMGNQLREGGEEWGGQTGGQGAGNDTDEDQECAGRHGYKVRSVEFHDLIKTNVGTGLARLSPNTKLRILLIIHLLQSFLLYTPRLLNHPKTHLKVITTVINSYINQSDIGLSFIQCILHWHKESVSFVHLFCISQLHMPTKMWRKKQDRYRMSVTFFFSLKKSSVWSGLRITECPMWFMFVIMSVGIYTA